MKFPAWLPRKAARKQLTSGSRGTSFFSRISVRLLAFNILLIFLPIAGFLNLGTYEKQLPKTLESSLIQQGRMMASALGVGGLTEEEALRILEGMQQRLEARIRVVDSQGGLLADSSRLAAVAERGADTGNVDPEGRSGFLYRIALLPVTFYRRHLQPPAIPLESGDFYSGRDRLLGSEIRDALAGRYGAATRISSGGQRSVTLYSAIPVRQSDTVTGAVLVSQSTYGILRDLYELRLQVFRIFLVSLAAAVILSLLLAMTISRPIRRLRGRAGEILDHKGRLRGSFPATKRRDEIGDLSRALRSLTARLERHLQFAESFASDVSHEFKNPLASIRTASETLAETEAQSERERFISIVLEEVARMEHLLNGVREITKIDARLDEENRERLNLDDVAGRIIDAYLKRDHGKDVLFEVKRISRDEKPCVAAAPERLLQILENLIDNAVSFSPEGGMVTVTVGHRNRHGFKAACLFVDDEGPGIPEKDRDRVFDRFMTNRMENGDHMGLGLSIVKAIVENRDSGAPGSRFIFPCGDKGRTRSPYSYLPDESWGSREAGSSRRNNWRSTGVTPI